MKLRCGDREYEFIQVALVFEGNSYQDVFSHKNNKTVAQTLKHRRYAKLKEEVERRYPGSLEKPLGKFLAQLKKLEMDSIGDFLISMAISLIQPSTGC